MKRFNLLGAVTWLYLVALAALVYVSNFVAESHGITTLIAYLPAEIFLLPGLVLVPWILRKKHRRAARWQLAVGIPLAAVVLGVCGHLPSESSGRRIRVMTYNVHHLESGWPRVRETIRAADPDVVCLMEVDSDPEVGLDLPGYHVVRRGTLAIAAKELIRDVRTVPLRHATLPALEARVGEITVVAVHLQSYFANMREVANVRELGHRFGYVAGIHRDQVDSIVREWGRSENVVVAGDFNTPARGLVYRRMNSRFEDAFADAGWGTGYTYPAVLPLLRIDFVWSRGLRATWARVIQTSASDHRPVVATLVQ